MAISICTCPPARTDTHSSKNTPPLQAHKLSTSFRKLTRSYKLFDAWRVKHPTHRQYTFYSPPHKLYSRLDHFLLNTPLLPYLVASEIGPITWSDHAPITLDLAIHSALPKTCYWRLNESLLWNTDTNKLLQSKLTEYFQLNEGSVSSFSTLWEAHKAFFTGECISVGSHKKQESTQQKSVLLIRLRLAEMHLLQSPTITCLRTVLYIWNQIKALDRSKISRAMLWWRQRF